MNLKNELYKELENDPFNLLYVKPKLSTHRDEVKIIKDAFEEILDFYEKNNREPNKENDRNERRLCSILEGIKEDENQVKLLKEFDRYDLLEDKLDMDGDPFGLLEVNNSDIFDLKFVSKVKDSPDYVAQRKVCKDFEKYENLFKLCHKDLVSKRRILHDFKGERFIVKGLFFVLKGVVGYISSIGKIQRKNNKTNARLHCIFENGTESDMLLRSLSAELYKDGKIISQLNEEIESNLNQVSKDDKFAGYIYILESKSDDEVIRGIENLYKIGYSTIKVDERIKNAKNEPTYLMADVKQIASYKTYNLTTQKLETLLHRFFGESCLNIEIIGKDGRVHNPREWFIVPLRIIKQVILLIENEEIIYYKYDENKQDIVEI